MFTTACTYYEFIYNWTCCKCESLLNKNKQKKERKQKNSALSARLLTSNYTCCTGAPRHETAKMLFRLPSVLGGCPYGSKNKRKISVSHRAHRNPCLSKSRAARKLRRKGVSESVKEDRSLKKARLVWWFN